MNTDAISVHEDTEESEEEDEYDEVKNFKDTNNKGITSEEDPVTVFKQLGEAY